MWRIICDKKKKFFIDVFMLMSKSYFSLIKPIANIKKNEIGLHCGVC